MLSLALSLLLAQVVTPVRVTDPSNVGDYAGLVNHSLKMTCISGCTGAPDAPPAKTATLDGGNARDQGVSRDGGVDWPTQAKLWDGVRTAQVTATSGGALQIECVGGTCGSAATFLDNAGFTFGTTPVVPMAGVLDDVATNVATENSAAAPRITPQRALHANLRNQAGTEVGTSGTPLYAAVVAPDAGTIDVDIERVSGTVDSNNSSTATLGVGGVFTGASTNVLNYASISINCFSDVASAAGGLSLQWSSDGTHWDLTEPYTITAGTGFHVADAPRAQFFRLVYTNGGTGQSAFRLQTILFPVKVAIEKRPVQDSPVSNDPAQLVTAVIYGVTTAGGGAYVPVKVNPSGSLTTATTAAEGLGEDGGRTWGVNVSNFPASQAVTGTFFQTTQPVAQSTSRDGGYDWGVNVDNFPAVQHAIIDSSASIAVTGPATDTQMRASPIPVSGTVTAAQATGTNLHAVIDTGSTTAVTQATGTNLHAVLDATSTTTVTQATGTNLHVVVDTAPSTAVTGPLTDAQLRASPVPTVATAVATANNVGTCVSVSTTATVLASNASRRAASVCAKVSNSDTAFVKLGATATTSNFPLEPGQCIGLSTPSTTYTGVVDAIANSGTQTLCAMELN